MGEEVKIVKRKWLELESWCDGVIEKKKEGEVGRLGSRGRLGY